MKGPGQLARWKGTTTQRGYGHDHQAERKRRLAQWQPGDPCSRCGHPMWNEAHIDLGHTPDRSGYTGLEHSHCNRSEGARRGNKRRRRSAVTIQLPWQPSRPW